MSGLRRENRILKQEKEVLTGSLLLMDIEVNSLSTKQSLKQPL